MSSKRQKPAHRVIDEDFMEDEVFTNKKQKKHSTKAELSTVSAVRLSQTVYDEDRYMHVTSNEDIVAQLCALRQEQSDFKLMVMKELKQLQTTLDELQNKNASLTSNCNNIQQLALDVGQPSNSTAAKDWVRPVVPFPRSKSDVHASTAAAAVEIGSSGLIITAAQNTSINWSSHRQATLDLCNVVFTRETLATHSLTGNPGPTGTAKPQLSPRKVAAVIEHIVKRFGCKRSDVTAAITAKCSSESKLRKVAINKGGDN